MFTPCHPSFSAAAHIVSAHALKMCKSKHKTAPCTHTHTHHGVEMSVSSRGVSPEADSCFGTHPVSLEATHRNFTSDGAAERSLLSCRLSSCCSAVLTLFSSLLLDHTVLTHIYEALPDLLKEIHSYPRHHHSDTCTDNFKACMI